MEFDGLLNILLINQLEEGNRRYNDRVQRRVLRDANDPFAFPEDAFIRYFRLNKNLAHDLINELGPHLRQRSRTTGISIQLRIFTALYFFAHGSYQKCVGAHYQLGLKQPTVSKVVGEVCNVMVEHLLKDWVVFPKDDQSRRKIQDRFNEKFNFPGIIGAIDGTHIAIIAPPTDHPTYPGQVYYNRKGYYSLNVKMICDADLRILYCNARFPGSCHDSGIWSICGIKHYLQRLYVSGHLQSSWLIGDSGYALQPWLMTPIVDAAEGTPEGRFTAAHIKSRNCIERCFGLLKQRFRCLLKHRSLHYSPNKAGKIIYSCVILHNMCCAYNVITENDGENFADTPEPQIPIINEDDEWLFEGRRIRDNLIEDYFS